MTVSTLSKHGDSPLGRATVSALGCLFVWVSPAVAKPPPFLPPALAPLVERARAQQREEAPIERAEEAPIEIVEVASGKLTLNDVLGMLSSPVYQQRELASDLLANVAIWDEPVLLRAASETEMTPEGRQRLANALYTRFALSPGPAVGIRMSNNRMAVTGVPIENVIDGYPAARVLRSNDVLLKIGEVDLRADASHLRVQHAIASHQPGDHVDMLVLRDDREVLLSVELGQFADLDPNLRQRDESVLRHAWTIRAQRLGLPHELASSPIEAPVSLFDWRRAAQRASVVRPGTGIVAGGEPSRTPGNMPGAVANIDNTRVLGVDRAAPRGMVEAVRAMEQQNAMMAQLNHLDAEIAALSARLQDARTPRHEIEKIRAVLAERTRQRTAIVRSLKD